MKKIKNTRFEQPKDFIFPEFFTNDDGKQVRYGHAKARGKEKGTVIITTGYADFIESYFETINDFLDRGYNVWIMDWQGQGGSERYYKDRRIPSKNAPINNIRDLHKFRNDIVKHDGKKPIYMVTHSMGGQMALHYMKDYKEDFDAAILAAPFVDAKFSKKGELKAKFFVEAACRLGFGHKRTSRKDNIVRRIKKVREALKKQEPIRMELHKYFADKNPDLKIGDPSFYWARAMMKQTEKLRPEEVLKSIKTPILFAVCENDRLVSAKAIRRAAKIIPNAKLVEIEDAYHGIWTERQKIRDEWWQHIDSFMQEQNDKFVKNKQKNISKKYKNNHKPKF